MKYLKYIFIGIILIYLSYRGFMVYKSNYVLSSEFGIAVILEIPDDEVDDFFKLTEGTYNKNDYRIVASMRYNQSYNRLDRECDYINLSRRINTYNYQEALECSDEKNHQNFQLIKNEEVGLKNQIVLRLIPRTKNYTDSCGPYYSRASIKEKTRYLKVKIFSGKNNILLLTEDGVTNLCK